MYEVSGELTVIPITIWWLQKLGRLAESKQAAQTFGGERFNVRKLNVLEVREQYQIEITNRFAALEKLSDDINRDWENFKENIKTSAKKSLGLHELK